MDFGTHVEAPYVYSFFAGVAAVLLRPLAPAAPVVAACSCQCDCAGTEHWGARALFRGAAALLILQAGVLGGCWAARACWRARARRHPAVGPARAQLELAPRAPWPAPPVRPRTLPANH